MAMTKKEKIRSSFASIGIPHWEMGDVIAAGSTGVVRNGKIHRDGVSTPVAIKTAPVSRANPLKTERGILYSLRGNPHILHCFSTETTYDFKTGEEFYHLLLELCPRGSLHNLIRARKGCPLPESQIRSYTRSILRGLHYMHSEGFVHCDIKPANIMVCNDEEVKIGDFGCAKKVGECLSTANGNMMIRGTLPYVAPESYLRGEYETKVDVWALGIVVVEMASGKSAWKFRMGQGVEGIKQAEFMIGRTCLLPELPLELSELGRDFLIKCLVKDPYKRWTAQMLLNHPFVAETTTTTGPCSHCLQRDGDEIIHVDAGKEEGEEFVFKPLRGVFVPQLIC